MSHVLRYALPPDLPPELHELEVRLVDFLGQATVTASLPLHHSRRMLHDSENLPRVIPAGAGTAWFEKAVLEALDTVIGRLWWAAPWT